MRKMVLLAFVAILVLALISCSNPAQDKPKSANADLSALTVDSGILSPPFAAATTSYTLDVANSTTSVLITGTKADAAASVSAPVTLSDLAVGIAQEATITVVAESGLTKTYTVKVTRAASISTNADLSALTLDSGSLSPTFSSSTTSYEATLPNAATSVTVTGTKADTNASVSAPVTLSDLVVGVPQTATITVTAQDATTTKAYSVKVTRAASISTNADLSALTLDSGSLSPAFSASLQSYEVSLPNSATSVTITGTKSDANASVSSPVTLSSLVVGVSQTATITVTAQDGTTTKAYTVKVTRAAPPSSNADLSALTLDSGSLSPSFSASVTSYTVTVPNSSTTVTVTGTKADINASVSAPVVLSDLLVGVAQTATIRVTAQDGTTSKTYSVVVTRDVPILTMLAPVLNFNPSGISRGARVIADSSVMSQIDYNVAMGCPALRGFASQTRGFSEGDSFSLSYLGSSILFKVSSFTGGAADRIASGVRYQGSNSDGSIQLLIDLDPTTKDFYYEQKFFFEDPSGVTNAPMKAYMYYKMKGTLSATNGFICHPIGIAMMKFDAQPTAMVFSYKDMEYFSGPWGSGTGVSGTGLIINMESKTNQSYSAMPASSGVYTIPDPIPSLAGMANAMGYLDSYLSGYSPGTYSNSLLMTIVDKQPSTFSALSGNKWPDGMTNPSSKPEALSRLPSETWKSLSSLAPADSVSGSLVYAAGTNSDDSNVSIPGYWKNGAWTALPRLSSTGPSYASAIVSSGADVYIGGSSANSSNIAIPGYWKNGTWIQLPQLSTTQRSWVSSIAVSGFDIYAAGYSVDNSAYAIPGYWKNGGWNALSRLSTAMNAKILGLALSGSDVYACGYNTDTSGVRVPGYWKNSVWIPLPQLSTTKNSSVFSLVLSGLDVYAGGYSIDSLGNQVPGYWKNGNWVQLSRLSSVGWSAAYSLAVSGSDVYAGGSSTDSANVETAGYWKNGIWTPLPGLSTNHGSWVNSLVIIGGDVYAGGACYNESNVMIPGYWKNGTWVSLARLSSSSTNSGDSEVYALIVQ